MASRKAFYVGLDVHQSVMSMCVLDRNGKKVARRTFRGHFSETLQQVISEMKNRRWKVCYEASCGYGYLHDQLQPHTEQVVVVHPSKVRLIFQSKRKNDRIDAERLAKLLFLGETPAVHVPNVEVRAWRSLITQRHGLVKNRTGVKNQIRALLRNGGHRPPKGLWTRAGIKWLQEQSLAHSLQNRQRNVLILRLRSLNELIKAVESELTAFSSSHPGVALLRTIPGVGIRTAETVVAYIDDPHRFRRIKSVGCYFGLIPRQDQSSTQNRLGHITKEGPAVARGLLVEAAWQAIRRSARVRTFFQRVRGPKADRNKIAIVATAHYLLRVMTSMLQRGEAWRVEAA